MGIDHDLVLSRLLEGKEVVVDKRLAVVMLAYREDIADITALDGVVTVLVHKVKGLVEMTLIVAHRRGSLVMHHQTNAL